MNDFLDLVVDFVALLIQLLYWHILLRFIEDERENLLTLKYNQVLKDFSRVHGVLDKLLCEGDLLSFKLVFEVDFQLIDIILVLFFNLLVSQLGAITSFRRTGKGIGLDRARRSRLISMDL